ncbi:inositol monophosphatase/fructose-1,6-bisphosphatase family protein [Xenococcus sp. PCC 7305]|uniref:inositol monophosphatase family protein n=1 Tax=Xenococcus sp. PCC 7305 TaxID=102125 RepID=UPI0002ABE1E7|nr:inositol monophosphatase family protein [Xenococcus sp. PCC 7305]ELS05513.1 inositol monophosphatase/fructose-1,6-bisphosphatase family protein [Xenococcus sp. PCC 7305]
MSLKPSPREIIATLLPHLRVAAGYARQIQTKIQSLPDKNTGGNFFTAALTDADLSIQTLVEVALLGTFPNVRFYGEEYEKSRNTKYFRSIELGEKDDYLVTLDPIDGTKFYLDGNSNYQIILNILNADNFEAVLAISPAKNCYDCAFRGEGVYHGNLDMDLDACTPLKLVNPKPRILLGWDMAYLKPILDNDKYQVLDLENSYGTDENFPNYNGIFAEELIGWVTKRGKFIDSAALAFMAQEAGCTVTDFHGLPLPALHSCENYTYSGIIVGANVEVHRDLLTALNIKY